MREVKKTILKESCSKCAKPQVLLEVNLPLEKKYLEYFISNNYKEKKTYTDIGILYIEDANLVAIGTFGSNKLQIKCKNADCDASLVILENVLTNIP